MDTTDTNEKASPPPPPLPNSPAIPQSDQPFTEDCPYYNEPYVPEGHPQQTHHEFFDLAVFDRNRTYSNLSHGEVIEKVVRITEENAEEQYDDGTTNPREQVAGLKKSPVAM